MIPSNLGISIDDIEYDIDTCNAHVCNAHRQINVTFYTNSVQNLEAL